MCFCEVDFNKRRARLNLEGKKTFIPAAHATMPANPPGRKPTTAELGVLLNQAVLQLSTDVRVAK